MPHRFDLRVYYEDTDFSGYVYHASYLRFMERARTEYLRTCGITNTSLFEDEAGLALVVGRMTIDYLRPARMDDALTVITSLEEAGGAVLRLAQTVSRGDAPLVTAKVLVAAIRGGRVARLPPRMRAAIANWEAAGTSTGSPTPDR